MNTQTQRQNQTQNQVTQQSQQITQIFNQNSVNDLNKFLAQRHCLNQFNVFLVYLFYLVQSAGILLTTIATNYNNSNLIYVGVGLNLFASMINIYEKVNNSLLKNMMTNIQAIKDNKYVDEGALVDLESIEVQHSSINAPSTTQSTTSANISTTIQPPNTQSITPISVPSNTEPPNTQSTTSISVPSNTQPPV